MGVEIERRFLVSVHSLPAGLDRLRHLDIEQGYTDGIRLRRSIDVAGREKFETCVKKGSGWVRIENENRMPEAAFWRDWDRTRDARLQKMRYFKPWKGYVIEINILRNKLEPLVLAEVEFRSKRQARVFTPPGWFGRDVTDDERYTGSCLARYGLDDAKRGLEPIRKEVMALNSPKLLRGEKAA